MKRTSFTKIAPLFFVTSLLFSAPNHAENVYKWVDEEGRIHYSDIKPNKNNVEEFKVRGNKNTSKGESVFEKTADLDARKQEELENKAEALQANTERRQQDARCQAIRDNLKKMNENSRIKIWKTEKPAFLALRKSTSAKTAIRKCSNLAAHKHLKQSASFG